MIRFVIYFDVLFNLGNSMSQIVVEMDPMIFLLQHLCFLLNLKKCVIDPVQEIEFLGLIMNSQTITMSLPEERIGKIKDQYLSLYKASEISLLNLTKLIGTLFSTIQAVLPARLQFYFLQK